jgi:hypothetical protein
MMRTLMIGMVAGGFTIVLAGCNTEALWSKETAELGPITQDGPMVEGELAAFSPTPEEQERIENVTIDRERYQQALLSLNECYREKGNHIKLRWTEQEMKRLAAIEPFGEPGPQLTARVHEVDLVEDLAEARQAYHQSLDALAMFYQEAGDPTRMQWVEEEQSFARRIQPFAYLQDAEIPGEWLRPTDSIPEADALYEQAYARMKEGGHGVWALYREDVMLDALDMMRRVIYEYPTSDKIDDAAFFIGEIHKEYLKDQSEIAVQWYERAWTWNPETPHQARFQAAVVYDYRMHDRAKALEAYHAVLKDETWEWTNVDFARKRIRQLTEESKDVP